MVSQNSDELSDTHNFNIKQLFTLHTSNVVLYNFDDSESYINRRLLSPHVIPFKNWTSMEINNSDFTTILSVL